MNRKGLWGYKKDVTHRTPFCTKGQVSRYAVQNMDRGSSQVTDDPDARRLLGGLDVQEAVRVPHVRILAPDLSKPRQRDVSPESSPANDKKAYRWYPANDA